jgi:hypothetical protein
MHAARWRWLSGLVSAVVGVGGLVLIDATPALATSQQALRPVSWAYTDSRTPNKSYINAAVDAPVGAWKDTAGRHVSRSYFTYDISAYRGQHILATGFVVAESQANDCDKARQWQLWTTDPVNSSASWNKPPRERVKVAEIGGTVCPSGYIEADLGSVVRDTLAAGRTTITFELRVPARLEGNLHYGRHVRRDPALIIQANGRPGTPTQLTVDGRSCDGDGPLYTTTTTPTLNALLTDSDINDTGGGDTAYGKFAVWPVDRPQDRIELAENWAGYTPARAWGYIPAGILQDGVTYAVAAQSRDNVDVSPWSAECRFTVDVTRPDQLPVASSAEYPSDGKVHGGPGITGTITFSANGVADVVGYQFGEGYPTEYVAAGAPGGPASIQFTPARSGFMTLYVQSVDRAGNRSDTVYYRFLVKNTAPAIEDADPEAWLGDPHRLTFLPNMPDTAKYTYQVDGGSPQTITSQADGTAQVTVVPAADGTTISVYGTTAAGVKSGQNSRTLYVSTVPYAESADFPADGSPGLPLGSTGTVTLKPHMHGVVAYVYQFNQYQEDEQPAQTVAAGPDGTVTIQFTPTRAGYNSLTVFTRTADGTESEPNAISFYVASIAPVVSSTDYPVGDAGGGGPGVEGAFVFQPTAANVVSYTYRFSDEPEQTVAAGAGGTATIHWTPQQYPNITGGWINLLVRSTSGSGLVSDWAYYGFRIGSLEPTVVSDVYQWPAGGTVGQPGTFTFTAHLAGSVEFAYSFDGAAEQTVAVGAGGTATVTWTPQTAYSHGLTVRSRTAGGLASGYAYTSLWVDPA